MVKTRLGAETNNRETGKRNMEAAGITDDSADAEEDGASCIACLSRATTIRSLPCGHAMCCELCTLKLIKPERQSLCCPNRCEVTRIAFLPSRARGRPRKAKMAYYEPNAVDAGARTFESVHDFLKAMEKTDEAAVSEAAKAALRRWGAEPTDEEDPGYYPIDDDGHVSIPYGITYLDDNFLPYREEVETITLPEGLRTIGGHAFAGSSRVSHRRRSIGHMPGIKHLPTLVFIRRGHHNHIWNTAQESNIESPLVSWAVRANNTRTVDGK